MLPSCFPGHRGTRRKQKQEAIWKKMRLWLGTLILSKFLKERLTLLSSKERRLLGFTI